VLLGGLPYNMLYCICGLWGVGLTAVTNARASEDNFPDSGARWKIGYTALFLAPMNIRPFFDVIWTTAVQPGNPYDSIVFYVYPFKIWSLLCHATHARYHRERQSIEMQAMVAILSQGPLGIGDGPGYTNMTLVRCVATKCMSCWYQNVCFILTFFSSLFLCCECITQRDDCCIHHDRSHPLTSCILL